MMLCSASISSESCITLAAMPSIDRLASIILDVHVSLDTIWSKMKSSISWVSVVRRTPESDTVGGAPSALAALASEASVSLLSSCACAPVEVTAMSWRFASAFDLDHCRLSSCCAASAAAWALKAPCRWDSKRHWDGQKEDKLAHCTLMVSFNL